MTSKEKAESLLALMYDVDFWDDEDQPTMQYHHAKKCTLIAVDEILENLNKISKDLISFDYQPYSHLNYWNEVKHEIEKL